MTVVTTIEQLEAIYGFPNDASTVKVADRAVIVLQALARADEVLALAAVAVIPIIPPSMRHATDR